MNLEVERQIGHGPGGDRYYYQIVDRDNKSEVFGNYDSDKEAKRIISLINRGYELRRLETEKKDKFTFGKLIGKIFEYGMAAALWYIGIEAGKFLSNISIAYNG